MPKQDAKEPASSRGSGSRRRPKLFFKNAPVNGPSQTEKGVARVELAFQIGEQKGDLGFVGGAGLHGLGLLGFCGYGQVLPVIQHSKNRA